ncbi:MAG: hypothetical protein PHZ00_05645 [Candidatus Peribacteraceae bacterium]|nr:hypothetical protein [Candidatus Peribacteraceae bacterium]
MTAAKSYLPRQGIRWLVHGSQIVGNIEQRHDFRRQRTAPDVLLGNLQWFGNRENLSMSDCPLWDGILREECHDTIYMLGFCGKSEPSCSRSAQMLEVRHVFFVGQQVTLP